MSRIALLIGAFFVPGLLALLYCPSAGATALMEGNRSRVEVVYDNGASASITCPRDPAADCWIDVVFQGEEYVISQETIGRKYLIYPAGLRIYWDRVTDSGTFTVHFEVGCTGQSDAQPSLVCEARLLMEDGRPARLSVFSREANTGRLIEEIDIAARSSQAQSQGDPAMQVP